MKPIKIVFNFSLSTLFHIHFAKVDIYNNIGERNREKKEVDILFDIAKLANNVKMLSDAYLSKATYCFSTSEFNLTKEYAEKSLELSQKLGDRKGEMDALRCIGNAYWAFGNYKDSLSAFESALNIAKELKDEIFESIYLGEIGDVYYAMGLLDKAKQYYCQALEIDNKTGNKRGYSVHSGNLGNVYDGLHESDKALYYHNRALEINREIGNRGNEAVVLCNIGLSYMRLGKYNLSLSYFEDAMRKAEKVENKGIIGGIQQGIAIAYKELGDIVNASIYADVALNTFQNIGAKLYIIEVEYLKCEIYIKSKRFNDALTLVQKAYKESNEISVSELQIIGLTLYAECLFNLGNIDEALKYLQDAIAILKQNENIRFQYRRTYLLYYKYLKSINKESDALEYLKNIYNEVIEKGNNIKDIELRESFFNNVELNKEIISEYRILQAVIN